MDLLTSAKPSIIVFGDIMLDHNIYTHPTKIANEAPVLVFNQTHDEYVLGGSGNVLHNINNLGCENLFAFGIRGNDHEGEILEKMLLSMGIKSYLTVVPEFQTIVKRRYFSENKIIFRTDKETALKTPTNTSLILEQLISIVKAYKIDTIVISDYNKGYLTEELCINIIKIANEHNIFTCVDPKIDYKKYIGCSLIKPNKKEAYRLLDLPLHVSLDEVHRKLHALLKCKYSVITLAEEGISLFDGDKINHQKTEIHSIIDVTGAGDIVCCILSYFFKKSEDKSKIIKLATEIATESVSHIGSYKIQREDLFFKSCIIPLEYISIFRNKYASKKIVFTNGCFDVLHKGHVELFKYCKSRGDIVVVGLNGDDSIKRLKGPSRPINDLQARVCILESISYIDHIVVFNDDTPYEVIKSLRPDLLIKGGDYKIENIVGREFAKETALFNFIDGYSSTKIIEKQ